MYGGTKITGYRIHYDTGTVSSESFYRCARGVSCLQFPYPTVLPGTCGGSVNLYFDI